MKTYIYNGEEIYLQKEEYRNNGTTAVLMYTMTGDLCGAVTVNLNSPMQGDSLVFLDTNNMTGIDKWLEENNLALPLCYCERSGFCSYPLYMLTNL